MSQYGPIKKIFDDRQIDKPLSRWNVGNICAPLLIRPFACEVLPQQVGIGMNGPIAIVAEPVGVPLPCHRANIELSHQSEDCLVIDLDPIGSFNPDLDPPVAVGLP